jgi:NAD(P)-dependent dehydrogenase (short-subunit alcohol dehydrogenase family)
MYSFKSSLKGKSGVITGGSSGFGLEMVKWLKSEGANVDVFSVDLPSDEAKIELDSIDGGKVNYYIKDIMKDESSSEIVGLTTSDFGSIDFAIINAGFAIRFENPLLEMDLTEIAASMRTQFDVFSIPLATLSLAVAKEMRKKYENIELADTGHPVSTGAIVTTLSEAALHPLRDDLMAYSAAKMACMGIMRSLAATLGPLNIRMNGIAPGFANTAGPQKFYSRFPNIKADIESRNHLKPSFMHPASVIPAVEYLLKDNYVTGETITLDGGYNINSVRYFQDY